MKLNLKYIITVSVLVGMTGCDDKIEPFEITGSTATPVAISASTVPVSYTHLTLPTNSRV